MTNDLMRAVCLHRPRTPESAERLSVDEVARPRAGRGQVLVEVRAAGLCSSDVHVVTGITPHGPLPLVPGHEGAGVVADVGEGVDGWREGDRAAVMNASVCQRCSYCAAGRSNLCIDHSVAGVDRDGMFAGFVVAGADDLVPLPPGIDFAEAAITTDAIATPYHALKRSGIGEGVTVAVYGLGGLGMHAVLLAKLAGAWVVGVDVDEVKLERALAWGADEVVEGGRAHRAVRQSADGGVDRALEFVGSADTVDQAVKSLRPGGRATIVGLTREQLRTAPIAAIVASELEIVGSFGSTAQDVGELFDLIEDGRLDVSRSVTDRITLDEVADALARLEVGSDHGVRTVVTNLS